MSNDKTKKRRIFSPPPNCHLDSDFSRIKKMIAMDIYAPSSRDSASFKIGELEALMERTR